MKLFTLLLVLLLSKSIYCQDAQIKEKFNFNRWSLEVNGGLNKTVRNFSTAYSSGIADFGELNFGVRYMFNAYAGLDLKMGFDRFQDGKKSPEFSSNMGRLQLQGIVNVGNVLKFHQWTKKLGLLMHFGLGRADFVESGFPFFAGKNDRIGTLTFGLAPQLKINRKLAINLDASVIGLGRMHHTWDYKQSTANGPKAFNYGINGHFFTGTVGITYYFGKKEQHADWSPTLSAEKSELDSIHSELEKLRLGMQDEDADGVPNYLDKEPNTLMGIEVDQKGVTDFTKKDTDKDAIPDTNDDCPDAKGPFATNGCPDQDLDRIADKDDKCPDVKGSFENEGCPSTIDQGKIGTGFPSSFESVYFETASTTMSSDQKSKLDVLVKNLKANPSQRLIANGHADNQGGITYNQNLSTNRAQIVKDYLVKNGIDSSRIEIFGFGENRTADSNETAKGRENNRRVEFQITH